MILGLSKSDFQGHHESTKIVKNELVFREI